MAKKKIALGVVSLLVVVMVLAATFLAIGIYNRNHILKDNKIMCYTEVGCVKVQTTCCPCSMGGEERCVTREEATVIKASLESCSKDTICPAVFNCKIRECSCVDGNCTPKLNK